MANITNAQHQHFTVPDAAAPSYLERGFVEAGTSDVPAATSTPKRSTSRRTTRRTAPTTKGTTDGASVRNDGGAGTPSTED